MDYLLEFGMDNFFKKIRTFKWRNLKLNMCEEHRKDT